MGHGKRFNAQHSHHKHPNQLRIAHGQNRDASDGVNGQNRDASDIEDASDGTNGLNRDASDAEDVSDGVKARQVKGIER